MGWFLVILGAILMLCGTQIKTSNFWAAAIIVAVWTIGSVAVIGLGVAVNQGWFS